MHHRDLLIRYWTCSILLTSVIMLFFKAPWTWCTGLIAILISPLRGAYNNTLSGNDMYWECLLNSAMTGQKTFQSTWKSTSYINENFLTFNKQTDRFNLNVAAGTSVQTEVGRGNEVVVNCYLFHLPMGCTCYTLFQNRSISITITQNRSSFPVSGACLSVTSTGTTLTLTGRG